MLGLLNNDLRLETKNYFYQLNDSVLGSFQGQKDTQVYVRMHVIHVMHANGSICMDSEFRGFKGWCNFLNVKIDLI